MGADAKHIMCMVAHLGKLISANGPAPVLTLTTIVLCCLSSYSDSNTAHVGERDITIGRRSVDCGSRWHHRWGVAAFLLLILCIFLLVRRRQRAHPTFKSPAHDNPTYMTYRSVSHRTPRVSPCQTSVAMSRTRRFRLTFAVTTGISSQLRLLAEFPSIDNDEKKIPMELSRDLPPLRDVKRESTAGQPHEQPV
jgi:hypothetical protein